MKILLYTFYKRWGLCSRVVWELTDSIRNADLRSLHLDRYYINGLNGVNGLLKKVETEEFDCVIGLGDYRKDSKKIRIEERFVNKYGKNLILTDGKDWYNSTWDILNKPHPAPLLIGEGTIDISYNAGNGPCNRSAYLVSELIERKDLKTKLLFLHVPRKMDLEYTVGVIQNLIQNLF